MALASPRLTSLDTTYPAAEPDTEGSKPHTPSGLLLAAYEGDDARLRAHLRAGIMPDVRTAHGVTPLHTAVANGRTLAAHTLIHANADINAADKVWSSNTPLRYAKDSNAERVVALLRRWGGR